MFGMLGCGRLGNWEVDVNQSCTPSFSSLSLVISHPQMHLQFQVSSIAAVLELVRFLQDRVNETRQLVFGTFLGGSLVVVVDEGTLRFKIVNLETIHDSRPPSLIEVSFGDSESSDLAVALIQAIEDAGLQGK